jgi:two-component system heavy metal sensor histidine kinase CusS
MLKRSISGRLALMFALASVLIVSAIGFLLRSTLHESLQKQMYNELLFRESLMEPWLLSRTTLHSWQMLPPNSPIWPRPKADGYSTGFERRSALSGRRRATGRR